MPAHSSFEQALAGVTAYNEAAAEQGRDKKLRSKLKKQTSKKVRKDSKRDSKRKRDGDRDKKKHKKRRRDSTGSSSDSEEEHTESLEMQLERGKAAARVTRTLLSNFPALQQQLRQIFWRLDNKEAVDVSSISDKMLRGMLEVLFGYLQLLKVKEGVYVRRKEVGTVLGQLGYILEETPAAPSVKAVAAAAAAPPAADASDPRANGSSMPPEPVAPPADKSEASTNPEVEPEGTPSGPIGPAIPEHLAADLQEAEDAEAAVSRDEDAVKKRIVGPAMPPPELLAQAAEVAEAMAAEEAELAAEALIGPPPPELVQEIDEIAGDARAAEVIRILKILDAASSAGKEADAYQVAGVEPDAKAADIKKRYWRLSLMIHPDKCDHPRAQDAFHAVSQAAKDLQDAGKRGVIDKRREDEELADFTRAALRQQEVERQWRVARGQATPEDLQGPIRAAPDSREEWLTVLPEAHRPSAPSQTNQKVFSQRAVAAKGQDASAWSDTPSQKLLRLQQASAQAALPSTLSEADQAKAALKAKAVDEYNQAHRPKTLVEKHLEQQKKDMKKEKKKKKKGTSAVPTEGGTEEWEGSHPWRPFDRDKDLQIGSRPTSQAALMKQMGNLSGRFGSSAQDRKFL